MIENFTKILMAVKMRTRTIKLKGKKAYKTIMCRRSTISVVELQGVSQGNSASGSERLRLPTASLTIVFSGSIRD